MRTNSVAGLANKAARACMLVNKRSPSRRRHGPARPGRFALLFGMSLLLSIPASPGFTVSNADAQKIGKKIWRNECDGTVAGLTSWNQGENFASLGIGHFIWYPKGMRGPFEESFPELVDFISGHGAKLPALLLGTGNRSCPWRSRAEFLAARSNTAMKQLRQFLVDTVDVQAQFLAARLEKALPKMLAEAPATDRAKIERQFYRVASSAQGCYALVDFVNFKGEGVLPTERYRGQGWGLLQVLQGMPDGDASAVRAFAESAAVVLTRRVQNSPPERHEGRWLPGWLNRVHTYTKE